MAEGMGGITWALGLGSIAEGVYSGARLKRYSLYARDDKKPSIFINAPTEVYRATLPALRGHVVGRICVC